MHGVDTILNVLGSVCLLLWGVRMVRTGLTRAFGATLRRAIAACSRNRFTAFAGGIGVTGLLQVEHRDRAAARLLRRPRPDPAVDRASPSCWAPMSARRIAGAGPVLRPRLDLAAADRASASSPSCRASPDKARHLGRVAIGLGLMLLSLQLLDAGHRCRCAARRPSWPCSQGLQDEYVHRPSCVGDARHLVRPFEPVDRAAGHVVCRAAA